MPVCTAASGVEIPRVAAAREPRLIGYAAGNFGKNLIWSGADVTLLYLLTDLLGISAAAAGTLMLVAVLGDLAFDLAVGALVSRARRRGLGYRSFLVAGALPCGAGFALLYALPALGERHFWVLAIALLVFRGAYAVTDVPHNALMARVARDSRGRGRVSGYRLFFSAIASLAVAGILTPAVQQASTGTLALLGVTGGLLYGATMLLAAAAVPADARPLRATASSALLPRFDGLFLAMAAIACITGFATPMFERVLLYFTTYVLAAPAITADVLLAVTLGQFPGVLLWTALVKRHEKTRLLAAGHAVAIAGLILFLLAGGNAPLLLAASAVIGVGMASIFMLPWGILADAVDFAEFRHGERRETAMFAAFLVVIKASAAASSGLIGWTIAAAGYVPGAAQGAGVRAAIVALGFGVPIAGGIAAIALLRLLALDHRRHARVQQWLEHVEETRRRAGWRGMRSGESGPAQGSSGSIGSTRVDAIEGRKVSSCGDSRVPILPG